MATANFTRGQRLMLNGHEQEIDSILQDGRLQLRDMVTELITVHERTALEIQYVDGGLKFIAPPVIAQAQQLSTPVTEFDDSDFTEAKRKLRYVQGTLELAGTEVTLRPAITSLHVKIGDAQTAPSWGTVLRWRRQYLTGQKSLRALLPRTYRRGRHQKQWPARVLDLAHEAINAVYLTREQGDLEQTYQRAKGLVERENAKHPSDEALTEPSMYLIRRLVEDIPFEQRMKKREGGFSTRTRLRKVTGKSKRGEYGVNGPLDRVEVDHTPLDLFVVDDGTGFLLGRPNVTACVDSYTRYVLGIHLTFQPPNYASAAQCLRMAFQPKSALLRDYPEIKNPWIGYGIPWLAIFDNALHFHGTSMENALYNLSMAYAFARARAGEDKPNVEGFLGELNQGVTKGVPGRTFGDIESRGDYDSAKHAKVPYGKLKSWIFRWINDVYHQRPKGYSPSPAQRWKESIDPSLIRLPECPEEFDIIMGCSDTRILGHNGIEFEGLFYYSDSFNDLRKRRGERLSVEIRYNDMDLGTIYVIRPDDGAIIIAKAREFEYASGRSLYVHKAIRAKTRERLSADDPKHWRQTLLEIQDEVQALRKTRTRRHGLAASAALRVARLEEGGVMAPLSQGEVSGLGAQLPKVHAEPSDTVEVLVGGPNCLEDDSVVSVEYERYVETEGKEIER